MSNLVDNRPFIESTSGQAECTVETDAVGERAKHPGSLDDAVEAALKEVGRAEKAHESTLARERKALAQYEAAKLRAQGRNSKQSSKVLLTFRQRAKELSVLRKDAAASLREAKKLLREQEQLAKEAARRERAKERALAAFLKKWEREYDLEMKRKKKNIALRKEGLQRAENLPPPEKS